MAHLAILKLSESWRNLILIVYHYMQKDNENIKI